MVMTEEEWHSYLYSLPWGHKACGKANQGAHEIERGRITAWCPECNQSVLLFVWGTGGWIDAQVNDILLETD